MGKRWWAAAAVAVVLGGAAAWWVTGRDCSRDGESAGSPVATDPSAAAEYWTPERMASARPVRMPVERTVRHCRLPW